MLILDRKAVRPSVTRVINNKTIETSALIFTPHERPIILVFRREEWLVIPELLDQTDPVTAKKRRFSILAVTSCDKVQLSLYIIGSPLRPFQ